MTNQDYGICRPNSQNGCAMQVHQTLRNGFQEVIYRRIPAIEFKYQGYEFERENEMKLYYRNCEIGIRLVDFF